MNPTDIYRQAIKRTFADLYGVAPHKVDVSWSKDGDNITVRFADKTFTHETIHDDDDPTLERSREVPFSGSCPHAAPFDGLRLAAAGWTAAP